MATQQPVMASTAAAMAMASSACCGTAVIGSAASPAASSAALVTADPGGRTLGSRGGTWCPAVDSHHCVTGTGASDWLAR